MALIVEDRFAITDLINLHGHLTDRGDLDGYGAIFTEDVVYDVSALGGGVLAELSAIRDAALALGEANPVAHQVTNIVLSETADGTVRVLSKGLGVMADPRDGEMSIMHAPRKRRVRHLHPPVDSGTVDDLLRFRERFGTDSHHRDEILNGELIVSPLPSRWHECVCQRLFLSLNEYCEAQGWDAMLRAEVELIPHRDHIQPDLTIFRDADSLPDLDNVMPLDHVLLVAEVVSEPSIKRDRDLKPVLCAQAGIPLYLLIDRFTEPLTVTLLSKPASGGYAKTETVAFGEKLHLPAPVQFTLDTSVLPLPG